MNSTEKQPLGGFEEWQLSELKQVVAERAPAPAPRMPRRRLAVVAAAAALAVGGVVGVPLLQGDNGSPAAAYTVAKNDDGTVTVRIYSFTDADGLERRLREAGANAVVDYTPLPQQCQEDRGKDAGHNYQFGMNLEQAANTDYVEFLLRPADIREGETLVVNLGYGEEGDTASSTMSDQLVNGPVAECEPEVPPQPPVTEDQAPREDSGQGRPLSNR